MTIKDVQALKKELLELDAELKRFKGEILAARMKQLEQKIHRPTSRSLASKSAMLAQSCCQSEAKA
jgi:hypothetical protein